MYFHNFRDVKNNPPIKNEWHILTEVIIKDISLVFGELPPETAALSVSKI